ncbi:hypothetical protein LOTGIDRAFT_176570 [Lottia gigantea]|uniref:non-specific serine/threonine protein kinase n=1 Tax=Lottia gigantea TaxID=225164 RepID=V4APF6_LOTGI|nr:hypothetical protein LOTGIDRAFT_176570 [Lottia gigantea]ESO96675.1 hypothetical protein LOTGIDRAFT_176570 [Lottia gigantea]
MHDSCWILKKLGNIIQYRLKKFKRSVCLKVEYFILVFNGLKILSEFDDQYKGPTISSQEEMADYLEPRLLGVLAFIDFQLMNPYIIIEDKRLALESLTAIIRLMGPKHISSIRHKDTLYEYIMGSETADPIVSQLISVLLLGCRDSDARVQMLHAQCLGEIGAIDQGRLELLSNNPKEDMAKFQASIEDDNFAIDLINELVFSEIMEVLTQVKKPDTRHGSASDFRHMSAQTIFSVIDYLTKWKRHRAQTIAAEKPNPKEAAYLKDGGYQAVTKFLDRIPQDELAEACFNCKAFTRALMHFEQYLSNSDHHLQDHLDFMQRLYVSMDEQDGVLGVAAVCQKKPTLIQEIRLHETLGNCTFTLPALVSSVKYASCVRPHICSFFF